MVIYQIGVDTFSIELKCSFFIVLSKKKFGYKTETETNQQTQTQDESHSKGDPVITNTENGACVLSH